MTVPASVPAAAPAADFRPLTEPVDRAAVRAFTQQLRADGRAPSAFSAANIVGVAIACVVGAMLLFMMAGFGTLFSGIAFGGDSPVVALGALVPVLFVAGIAAIVITVAVRALWGSRARRYRLDRFARANAMTYLPTVPAPPLPGMVFGLGSSRVANDVVRGTAPRFVEFANYRYTTGSGKDRTTHAWGYVAIRLDVPLPHIVLDAEGNNGLFGSNLPASFDRDQRLSLEGDFDRYFTLYCPQGYERDALYLFTPDIMARFIDNAAALDVEIIDDWMFLYAKRDFSTLDPATWAWLFSVVGAFLDKIERWGRWRDDRLAAAAAAPAPVAPTPDPVPGSTPLPQPPASAAFLRPPPGVAPQGTRLRRAFPWAAVVIGGSFVLFWLLLNSGFFGALLSGF